MTKSLKLSPNKNYLLLQILTKYFLGSSTSIEAIFSAGHVEKPFKIVLDFFCCQRALLWDGIEWVGLRWSS